MSWNLVERMSSSREGCPTGSSFRKYVLASKFYSMCALHTDVRCKQVWGDGNITQIDKHHCIRNVILREVVVV